MTDKIYPRASFRRRFGSYIYDALMVLAVFMTVSFVGLAILIAVDSFGFIHLVRDEFAIDWQQSPIIYNILLQVWNVFWIAFFFIYFWSKSGQTIGMRAWRLKVQNLDGSNISKWTGVKRLIPTLLGLGNLTVIIDRKNKLSLQDRLTNTEVVVLTLEENRARTNA